MGSVSEAVQFHWKQTEMATDNTSRGTVSANGSKNNQAETNDRNGGGGSGGSIRLAGNYIVNNGTISAKEELVQSYPVVVVDESRSTFDQSYQGTVDVGSGDYTGTIVENSTPIIINPGVLSITHDNLNYQAYATRANDLVLWYKFDETSGTSKGSSGNGRDGTAVNAVHPVSSRVMGNGLKPIRVPCNHPIQVVSM